MSALDELLDELMTVVPELHYEASEHPKPIPAARLRVIADRLAELNKRVRKERRLEGLH